MENKIIEILKKFGVDINYCIPHLRKKHLEDIATELNQLLSTQSDNIYEEVMLHSHNATTPTEDKVVDAEEWVKKEGYKIFCTIFRDTENGTKEICHLYDIMTQFAQSQTK